MTDFEGFFTLSTPLNLVAKLRHDLSRIHSDFGDTYAAFDFFVTAEHVLDWKLPDSGGTTNRDKREHLRRTVPVLRVTSHIASGAKHFKALSARHESVDDLRTGGLFDPAIFDPAIFDTAPRLYVNLAGDDAAALGATVEVVTLAEQVLAYWENDLSESGE